MGGWAASARLPNQLAIMPTTCVTMGQRESPMAPPADRESKRRSSTAQPLPPPPPPPKPLTWEEEELAVYEPKRAKAVEERRIAAEKAALLDRDLPHQWHSLREIVLIRCESINSKAGRVILHLVDPREDYLEIRREDESKMEVRFEEARKKVTFFGKGFGYEREYELIVQSFGELNSTIWFSHASLTNEQPDEIAKAMIATFLRAEESPLACTFSRLPHLSCDIPVPIRKRSRRHASLPIATSHPLRSSPTGLRSWSD